MFYIISLKHTHKEDNHITLWRPDNSGYCYAQDQAGKYEEIIEGYHNGEGDSLPIEVEKLDGFFINSDIVSKNQVKRCIPNCKQVWDVFNLKMTKRGLVVRS
jgi:hypothetical protein